MSRLHEGFRRAVNVGWRTAAAGLLVASMAGCESPKAPVAIPTRPPVLGPATPGEATTPAVSKESIKDPEKQKLFDVIESLPSSPLKTIFSERILPIYGNQPPKELDYHGVKIPLITSKVTSSINRGSINVNGTFSLIGKGLFQGDTLHPIENTVLQIPYVGPLLPSERAGIPRDNISADGTPFRAFEYRREGNYYSGFAPAINLFLPDPNLTTPVLRRRMEVLAQSIRLKEGYTNLAYDLWIEETVGKMQSLHLPTAIEMRKSDDSTERIEVVSYMFGQLHKDGNRIVAVLDLAGYYFFFKAAEGTDLVGPQYMDQNILSAYESTKRVPLGRTHTEMINAAILWAITAPEARKLLHVGNIDKLP